MAKAKRVESWGDIPNETFEAFYKAVEKLREEMIPRDGDNDSPIEVMIVNRMTHAPIGCEPVPRAEAYSYITHGYLEIHPDRLAEMTDETERALTFNVKVAADALDRHMSIKQHYNYVERQSKRPAKVRINEACEHCKNKVAFDPENKGDFYKNTRAKNPDYPYAYHVGDGRCTAFEIHRAEWRKAHGEIEPEPRYCSNPKCRARLADHNSKKGVNDKDICLNSRCRKDNSK